MVIPVFPFSGFAYLGLCMYISACIETAHTASSTNFIILLVFALTVSLYETRLFQLRRKLLYWITNLILFLNWSLSHKTTIDHWQP